MASNVRVYFAGVVTTFVVLAIGFGGGLMLAQDAKAPTASSRSVADRLPRVRVILPTSAEAAITSPLPAETAASSEPAHIVAPVNSVQESSDNDRQAKLAERRKVEDQDRARRKNAERKARHQAARLVKQQREQQQQEPMPQPGILAFGRDADQSRGGGGFFGN